MNTLFHGSYAAEDVTFLLTPYKTSEVPSIAVEEKEKLIQSGQRHYSEFFTREKLPTDEYKALFRQACRLNRERFAGDLLILAAIIAKHHPAGEIILVSLARAGTPVGVVLKHLLQNHFHRQAKHYSISIIRDRGIDVEALDHIRCQPGVKEENLVFVDGWTGKGVISEELQRSISRYNHERRCSLSPDLYVVADISGTADYAATCEDYIIPSAIFNSTISGLVSRTILSEQLVAPGQFHACVYYQEYEQEDMSREFITDILAAAAEIFGSGGFAPETAARISFDKKALKEQSRACIRRFMNDYHISSRNYIKPGIGEATRVLLRRVADCVILREAGLDCTAHLQQLAREKDVEVKIDPAIPYYAMALIYELP